MIVLKWNKSNTKFVALYDPAEKLSPEYQKENIL